MLRYYKTVDPTFDKFTQQGEDELKDFIDRRKNPHKYIHEVKEMYVLKYDTLFFVLLLVKDRYFKIQFRLDCFLVVHFELIMLA